VQVVTDEPISEQLHTRAVQEEPSSEVSAESVTADQLQDAGSGKVRGPHGRFVPKDKIPPKTKKARINSRGKRVKGIKNSMFPRICLSSGHFINNHSARSAKKMTTNSEGFESSPPPLTMDNGDDMMANVHSTSTPPLRKGFDVQNSKSQTLTTLLTTALIRFR
jgi:hypothetical protein